METAAPPEKRTLRDELPLHKGETVFIGVRSSFFFIGPAEEALEGLDMLDSLERAYAEYLGGRIGFARITKPEVAKHIGDRLVKEAYQRDPFRKGEAVIIVEGKEFGGFWSREEYLKGRDRFLRAGLR